MNLNTILDLGSGVSTLILRSEYEHVTSVDTQEKWVRQTEKIIKDILDYDISVLTNIASIQSMKFDFMFYDYGNLEDRIFNFPKLLSLDTPYIS